MNRLLLIGLLIYGVAMLGLFTLQGSLLILVIPLAIYLGSGLLYGPEDLSLKITRQLGKDRVVDGAPIEVTLTIINEGKHLEELFIVDHPPPFA